VEEVTRPESDLMTEDELEGNNVFLVGDLATEALEQSSLESHDYQVKCPKCGSTNVLLLENICRGKADMITWLTGGQ